MSQDLFDRIDRTLAESLAELSRLQEEEKAAVRTIDGASADHARRLAARETLNAVRARAADLVTEVAEQLAESSPRFGETKLYSQCTSMKHRPVCGTVRLVNRIRAWLAETDRKADPGADFDQEFLSLKTIARLFGLKPGPFRKRAEAWRKQQKAPGFHYRIEKCPEKRQSTYTYRVGALRPIIDDPILRKSEADT
jgi:hypothetical protein